MGKCSGVVRDIVRGMLREGLAEEVVAFGRAAGESGIVPLFITDEQDIERIVTTSYYPCGLTRLVTEYGDKNKKIGMVVRSCDARLTVELANRQQINLENIYLIGIECYGVAKASDEKHEYYIFPDEMEIDGELKPLDEAILSPNCRRCEYPIPTMADVSCRIEPDGGCFVTANTEKGKEMLSAASASNDEGPPTDVTAIKERAARWQESDFGELKKMDSKERLSYWLSQFDKCIKCYGCRNACSLCYCKACVLEPERQLIQGGEYPPDDLFHMTRLIHVADGCTNCGQCEAACPAEIPVSRLYHMLHKELSSLFDYESGFDTNSLLPTARITEEDLTKTGVDLD